MSQSTISFHLRSLEDRVGFPLCLRGRAGFRLTEQGEEVLEKSKEVISAITSLEHSLSQLRHRVGGVLRVGFVDNTITNPDLSLGGIIKSCMRSAPDAEFQLTIADPEVLVAEVVKGSIDIAVAPQVDIVTGLKQVLFYSEPHSLYCSQEHPLYQAAGDQLQQQEVEKWSFVARPYANKRELAHFPNATVRAYASNMEAQAAFILSGNLIGYLPDHFANRWVASQRLKSLMNSARILSPFVYITHRQTDSTPLLKVFVREISKIARSSAKPM